MCKNKTGLCAKLIKRGGVEWKDLKLLMCNIPCPVVALFAVSVVLMNLLANKELATGIPWLALDCGFIVSWLSFLIMDMITKHYGAKASIEVSIFASMCNLFVCGILVLAKYLPGNWGEFYTFGLPEVNQALNNTIGGTWYVLLGSTIAFIVSSIVNALINTAISRISKSQGFKQFALRSYISTGVAQFVDNFIFAFLVSHVFFGWSMLQVITCSFTGCIMELLCEMVFGPIGYKVSSKWNKEGVGYAYITRETYSWR